MSARVFRRYYRIVFTMECHSKLAKSSLSSRHFWESYCAHEFGKHYLHSEWSQKLVVLSDFLQCHLRPEPRCKHGWRSRGLKAFRVQIEKCASFSDAEDWRVGFLSTARQQDWIRHNTLFSSSFQCFSKTSMSLSLYTARRLSQRKLS